MFVQKDLEKNLKSMNKVHPRLYKMKQKETKNVLHLNNIRKKNTLPINKQRGAVSGCALLSGQIIL